MVHFFSLPFCLNAKNTRGLAGQGIPVQARRGKSYQESALRIYAFSPYLQIVYDVTSGLACSSGSSNVLGLPRAADAGSLLFKLEMIFFFRPIDDAPPDAVRALGESEPPLAVADADGGDDAVGPLAPDLIGLSWLWRCD